MLQPWLGIRRMGAKRPTRPKTCPCGSEGTASAFVCFSEEDGGNQQIGGGRGKTWDWPSKGRGIGRLSSVRKGQGSGPGAGGSSAAGGSGENNSKRRSPRCSFWAGSAALSGAGGGALRDGEWGGGKAAAGKAPAPTRKKRPTRSQSRHLRDRGSGWERHNRLNMTSFDLDRFRIRRFVPHLHSGNKIKIRQVLPEVQRDV